MGKDDLMQVFMKWPDLHFTAIKKFSHNELIEIYAIDMTSQTQSRLLLLSTSDIHYANNIMACFQLWLDKFNKEKRKL